MTKGIPEQTNDELIEKQQELIDELNKSGNGQGILDEILEIERELTLREGA